MSAADGLAFARHGYEDAATAWAEGAELVYGPMAEALLARAPDLTGRLVLDVGAGTGAVSRRLLAAGARALAVDASWPMLAHRATSRPPAVVGDIGRLPLVDDAVDGAAAAFVLNHLADPVAALVEVRRVVRPGGFIVASVFSQADPPAAKAAIDGALAKAGWEPPEWYRFLKTVDGQLGSAGAMSAAARGCRPPPHRRRRRAGDHRCHRPARHRPLSARPTPGSRLPRRARRRGEEPGRRGVCGRSGRPRRGVRPGRRHARRPGLKPGRLTYFVFWTSITNQSVAFPGIEDPLPWAPYP